MRTMRSAGFYQQLIGRVGEAAWSDEHRSDDIVPL
jgi:hypothetical protein